MPWIPQEPRHARRRLLAASALLLVLGLPSAARSDEAAAQAKALATLVAALPAEVVPLRLRIVAELPPTRVPGRRGSVLLGLHEIVWAVVATAGFVEVEDRPGVDSPLLEIVLRGTDEVREAKTAKEGEGPGQAPGLSASIQGELRLSKQGGPAWIVPLQGRATRALRTTSDALRTDAPFPWAVRDSGLLPHLLDLVEARKRPSGPALLRAYAAAEGLWVSMVVDALDVFEEADLARWFVALLPDEKEGLGEAAAALLPFLGAAAVPPLLASPTEGALVYRWRRLLALRHLGNEVGSEKARIVAEHRTHLTERSALLRITALRGLAELEGARAAPELIAALAEPQPSIAEHARLALETISGQKHGLRVEGWQAWARTQGAAGGSADTARAGPVRTPLLPFGARPRRGLPAAAPGAKPGDPLTAALERLAKAQLPNGIWAARAVGFDSFETGVTAVGLLAFQACGHGTREGEPYARVVGRALEALLKAQEANARTQPGFVGPDGSQNHVGHALATLALLNAWAQTPTPALQASAQLALDWIALARNPYFGWRYGVKPGDNDSFVTSQMLLPLYAARAANTAAQAAGLEPPFRLDPECFVGAAAFFQKMTDAGTGVVGYVVRGASHTGYTSEPRRRGDPQLPAATLTGAAALLALQEGELPAKSPGLQRLLNALVLLPPGTRSDETPDLLGWWQASLAFARAPKEKSAKTWEQAQGSALQKLLLSKDLVGQDRWGWLCGESYVTALAVLASTAKDFLPALEPSRPDLARAVQDAKLPAEARGAALTAWALVAPGKALPVATAWLGDADPTLRRAAAEALLARAGASSAALPELSTGFAALPESDREAVVRLYARLASASAEARNLLLTAMSDPAAAVRAAAAAAWPEAQPLPELARDALLALLATGHGEGVAAALRTLGRTPGVLTMARVKPALAHADERTRAAAVSALAGVTAPLAERLAALEKARADQGVSVRHAAALGLGTLGAAEAVVPLRALLEDADEPVGSAARDALARLAAQHAAALDTLAEALTAPAPPTRRRAAEALVRVGPQAVRHQPTLHAAIKAEIARAAQRDPLVLLAMAEARWAVTGDAEAVGGLLQGVLSSTDTPTEVVVRTIELMGRLPASSDHGAAGRLLYECLESGPVALAVLNAIADLGSRGSELKEVVAWYLEHAEETSETYAHALVAQRRLKGE